MKPRVFVSSTYYDLKHIRNSIERFIKQYGFEPVLFESGDVYFDHNQELDISCYNEVDHCQVMILVIGGRYGAPASEDKQTEFIERYENKYISITRNEFKKASENKIPIFIFIEKNVYAEYHTYKKNKESISSLLNNPNKKFDFAYVDDANVFDFIDEVKIKALCSFERYDEIENYLRSQFAGMFYTYLNDLRTQRDKKEVLNSVIELQNISNRMNEMVDEIGKSVLSDSGKYEDAVKKQNDKTISLYTKKIVELIKFQDNDIFGEQNEAFEPAQIIFDSILNNDKCYDKNGDINDMDIVFDNLDEEIIKLVNEQLKNINKNLQIVSSINFIDLLTIFKLNIKPLFVTNGLESVFKETLERDLYEKLWKLPF